MLVLHGFWSNSGGMRLWAEDSDLLVKSPSQALRSARPHPFAAPADLIAGIHPGKPARARAVATVAAVAPQDAAVPAGLSHRTTGPVGAVADQRTPQQRLGGRVHRVQQVLLRVGNLGARI